MKIRYFGIYNHSTRQNLDLKFVQEPIPDIDNLVKQSKALETGLERFERLTRINPCQCPVCKTGKNDSDQGTTQDKIPKVVLFETDTATSLSI